MDVGVDVDIDIDTDVDVDVDGYVDIGAGVCGYADVAVYG